MTSFDEIFQREFPGALGDAEYVGRTVTQLRPHGFTSEDAIACLATCRDEICRSLHVQVQKEWGETFNLSSLGGMLTLGRTGFHAFHAHAPRSLVRRQHIYYAMPHIGIGDDGTLGVVDRRGIPEGSKACGALFALAEELEQGRVDLNLDMGDLEQSRLKMRLVGSMRWDQALGPVELVKLAEQAIREDLEAGIAATVDTGQVDYGLFTGVQIHGPGHRDYIFPGASYAVVNGWRHELSL